LTDSKTNHSLSWKQIRISSFYLILEGILLKGRNHLIGNGFERQMVFETGFGIGRNFV
jgi:hypothetical protein